MLHDKLASTIGKESKHTDQLFKSCMRKERQIVVDKETGGMYLSCDFVLIYLLRDE